MILREITVGRSKTSDIYLDPRCQFASNNHATIYCDGNQLMYKDTSTNGTMINNVSVRHRAVPINRGDIIMVAGKYQINWAQIDAYFPSINPKSPTAFSPIETSNSSPAPLAPGTRRTPANLSRWNWGAFSLYPIWGFFNGCWWAFLVGMFLGWTLLPSIMFGVFGTRMSWENKQWTSVEAFESSCATWNTVGLVIFCFNLFVALLYIVFLIALVS